MRIATLKVFDNMIVGTTAVYTSAEFDRSIAQGDALGVQAIVTNVSGTSPTLTVASEMSPDDQNWIATGETEISTAIQSNTAYAGDNIADTFDLGPFVRFKITLGASGGTPQCQLKLYVTCRARSF